MAELILLREERAQDYLVTVGLGRIQVLNPKSALLPAVNGEGAKRHVGGLVVAPDNLDHGFPEIRFIGTARVLEVADSSVCRVAGEIISYVLKTVQQTQELSPDWLGQAEAHEIKCELDRRVNLGIADVLDGLRLRAILDVAPAEGLELVGARIIRVELDGVAARLPQNIVLTSGPTEDKHRINTLCGVAVDPWLVN